MVVKFLAIQWQLMRGIFENKSQYHLHNSLFGETSAAAFLVAIFAVKNAQLLINSSFPTALTSILKL